MPRRSPICAPQRERPVVDLEGGGIVAVELGEDREVAVGRRDARQVADLLADAARVLVARLRRRVVALELGDDAGEVEHVADAGVGSLRAWNVASAASSRAVASSKRLWRLAVSASDASAQATWSGSPRAAASAGPPRRPPRPGRARRRPGAPWRASAAPRPAPRLEERHEPLEVLDRRRVRVGRPRGVGGPAQVAAACARRRRSARSGGRGGRGVDRRRPDRTARSSRRPRPWSRARSPNGRLS